ncbi:unnamed protein product [Oppiella nova]|uniref:Uncharacterized protein n=1 Tax=Oppiella nova TaxID=334625 RepID=A0A7R9LKT1_9ACAR|nr:unnamed protein product [Oppiella nova]CAG2164570.1 unnamed protein product [Oppiella nova]
MNDLMKVLLAFVVFIVIQVSKQEEDSQLIQTYSQCIRCQEMDRQCAAIMTDKRSDTGTLRMSNRFGKRDAETLRMSNRFGKRDAETLRMSNRFGKRDTPETLRMSNRFGKRDTETLRMSNRFGKRNGEIFDESLGQNRNPIDS